MNLTSEKHQNFEHNIKKEPEAEFLCILPSFDIEIAHRADLVQVKQESETQSVGFLKLQCKICQKIVGSKISMSQHEKSHQKQQCKVCNRKFLQKSIEKHMEKHQNEKK